MVHPRAVKGRMAILSLKSNDELTAQNVHFGVIEETTEKYEAEGIEVLLLSLG